ncbi:MAG: YkvA family protein [Gemmatimonadota bacterium]
MPEHVHPISDEDDSTLPDDVDSYHDSESAPVPPHKAKQVLVELALFLPHFALLLKRLLADPRVPKRSKLVLGGTFLYLVSPIDVIPDFVPGLGQLDDIVVALLALHSVLNRVDEEVVIEHWDGRRDVILTIRQGVAAAAALLPGDWDAKV